MLLKPKECFGCPLYMVPNGGFSVPEGNVNNGVLIVGEALGQKEKMDGLPLRPHAESGSVLQTVFRRLERQGVPNSDRLDFLLWNLIACQPPRNLLENQPYEEAAILHCRVHFQKVLEKFHGKVKCVLALGNLPLRYLCPEIMELVKNAKQEKNKKQLKKLGSTSLRGYAFNSILGIPIVSTIHPSFIARGERLLLHVLKRDVYFAMQVAKDGIPKFQHDYITEPSFKEANEFYEYCRRNSNLAISYDIETPDTILETDETEIEYENIEVRDITSIQFSLESGKGIFLPWYGEYVSIAARILALSNTKLGWNNWKFDQTNLEYHLGKGCIKGENLDMMWCLYSSTKIALANGTFKSIKELVDNKIEAEVLSKDNNGNTITTKIINWHKHTIEGQEWVRVTNDLSRFPIYLTPDHEVFIDNEKIQAKDLQIGMNLEIALGGADDVIHGCLLGDSWFNKKDCTLRTTHGKDQEKYAKLKAAYFGAPIYNYIDPNFYSRFQFSLRASYKWRKLFYRKDCKLFIPPPTDRALAIWYMDDGNLSDATSTRKNPYYIVRFATMGFFNQDEMFDWFKAEFGPTNVSRYAASNSYMIVLSGIAKDRLLDRVAPFIPDCMAYKLENKYLGRYNNWFSIREPHVGKILDIKIGRRFVPSIERNVRYCISVEHEAHRFFTMGGLVANCWKHANPDFVKTGRALQFAANFFAPELPAWKHKSESDPKEYGCIDVDSVVRIDNGLTPALKEKRFAADTKSLYEGYIDDIVNLRPILLDMTARGLPIDMEAREEMRKMLNVEIRKTSKAIQELYPFQLRKADPKFGYKYVPKEIDELTNRFNELYRKPNSNGHNNQYIIFGEKEDYQYYLSKFIEQKTRVKQSKKRDGTIVDKEINSTGLMLVEFTIDGVKEKRWCRLEKYKPGSTQQTIRYIEYKGYKVPETRDFRKGNKPTTTKDKISELFDTTGDKLFEFIVYARELRKLKSTYVDSKRKGWVVGKDNRIHADFLPLPATGQLSSKIHNAPARGTRFSSKGYKALADQFRKTICAGQGKLLLSGDWSAFHALTLGFEAEDSEYMRLVRLDVHSYVAAYILAEELPLQHAKFKVKKPDKMEHSKWIEKVTIQEEMLNRLRNLSSWLALPDDQLGEQLKFIKKNYEFTRNAQAKPAILGMGFGMREHKFYKLNRYSFENVKACEKLIETIRKLFPKTFVDFHKNILERADRDEYLISRYGYIRWFNDVFDWRMVYAMPKSIRVGERVTRYKGRLYHVRLGNDSNKAIAFLPANDAFGVKKEKMRELYQYQQDGIIVDKLAEYSMINEIHDDLMFEVEENKVEEAAKIVKSVMQAPAKYLKNSVAPDGLITGVEIKVGKNWGAYNDNPNKGILNLSGMKELKI